jgi:DNA repair exonuclease SbcCD ATPase subunit
MSVQRKSSSPVAPSAAIPAENDLETTAELPVLDVAAYEAASAAEGRSGTTDTWIIPASALPDAIAAAAESVSNTATVAAPAPAAVSDEKRTQLEVALHALSDDLRAVEERLKRKGERLTEIEKALGQASAERAVAEQRSQQLTAELAQARTALAAAEARAAELQRGLVERDSFEEKLALRDKALALVQQDLTTAQALAVSYLESLQSLEGRRGIFQEISASLYWEVDERDARIGRLEGELAAAQGHAQQLESRLGDRILQVSKLEQQVSGLSSKVTRGDAEHTTLISSVNSLESKLAEARTRNAELEAASRTAVSRADELEAANAVQRKRAEQLEAELTAVRTELQQRSTALQEASTERSEHLARIAASDARVKELEGRVEEQHECVRVLQADSNAAIARAKELEGDLRAAEDMINRLETELRGRIARLDELEKTNTVWRATVEEARAALTDRDSLIRRLEEETANSAVLLGAIQQRLDSTGTHEVAPEGDKRLLIRSDGDSDVVHVLGRKTSVGRTPDNDLQIDAKYISRHHAVILAGPAHTIIEDLNSTNGVLVNGRRITRQTLKDGDAVVIGKTSFRFAVRPVGERRDINAVR